MADVKVERPRVRALRQGRALSMRGLFNRVIDKVGAKADSRLTLQTFVDELIVAYPDASERMKFLFRSLIDEV